VGGDIVKGRRQQIWVHALGAKAGGGITYLYSVLPELVRQLDGAGVEVHLLLPGPLKGVALPEWLKVHVMPRAAKNAATRLLFDQLVLPLWLKAKPGAILYCSGSYSPLLKTVPTVALLRNAIYFDDEFLRRELPLRRFMLKFQGWLITRGARGCKEVHYPSRSMRELVEAKHPSLAARGFVNYYGVNDTFVTDDPASESAAVARGDGCTTFLYVMNYTLQKNVGFLLQALALAKQSGVKVRVMVTSWLNKGPKSCFKQDRALIAEHDLINSGYLVPVGPKHGEDLLSLYRMADGCVFPSICESFGHPLVEAMAMDKPLICADRPYARELCGDAALYVDPARPESLVRAWEQWLQDGARGGARAKATLPDRISWRAHVANLLGSLGVDAGGQKGRP
jgi:glycosyltransferase involved in cell wall biosynthesis